jgi:large subunit ribosomal protein L17
MRHRNYGGKLGRTSSHRKAMLRNMVTSLLDHERIETTDAKARELRRVADRMITLGKRGDVHARRQALSVIRSREVAGKVFGDLAERFRNRPGGYTRVLKVRTRVGDAAPLSIVELVEGGGSGARAPKSKDAKTAKPAASRTAKAAKPAASRTAKAAKPAASRTAKKQESGAEGKSRRPARKKAPAEKS